MDDNQDMRMKIGINNKQEDLEVDQSVGLEYNSDVEDNGITIYVDAIGER